MFRFPAYSLAFATLLLLLFGCQTDKDRLPFLGEKIPVQRADGTYDSLPHTISDFSFINQNGQTITQKDVEGKIYVADFFFTHCPTICPKVKKQMQRVYEQFKNEDRFTMLSHSIDTRNDTVGRLAWYAERLKISAPRWHLLTGDKDAIYKIAYSYLLTALEDKDAPGGFDHSGSMALIDGKRRIRGMYDGLDPASIDRMMLDIAKLLKEQD